MSRGGGRPGAGRPRLTLLTLVAEGRFDPLSVRHRRLLEREELPGEADADLRTLQQAYRSQNGSGTSGAWLARAFAHRVEELHS